MRLYYLTRDIFWFITAIVIVFVLLIAPARAANEASLTIQFGQAATGTNTIGKSFPLLIDIVAGANPIRGGSLTCSQNGTSLSASSISRLPNTVLIGAGQSFKSEQYYRTVAVGTTSVSCVFKGTDTVTGLPFTITSNTVSLDVSGEARLVFEVSANLQNTITTGQDVYLTAVYTNRGSSTLTNISVFCGPGNLGFLIQLNQQTRTTLPPGQSGFAQFVAPHVLAGAYLSCGIVATDSSTGETIVLNSPFIRYTLVA